MKKLNYFLITFIPLFIFIQCDDGNSNPLNGNTSFKDALKGNWYVYKTSSGNKDSTYSFENTLSIIQVEDSVWREYVRTDTATFYSSLNYSIDGDSVLNFKSKKGVRFNTGVSIIMDTLLVKDYEGGVTSKTWYLHFKGNVPPDSWPQKLSEIKL